MAEAKTEQPRTATRTGQGMTRREGEMRGIRRWEPGGGSFTSPFELMDRMSEEMDRVWERMSADVGLPRRFSRSGWFGSAAAQALWAPRIEAMQQGDRFVVRAELPGLKKDDVTVELTDEALTIRGERREEREEEREGYFHSERQYGQFHRSIPLPVGVIAESANASFRDGVLEVTMQAAPPEANRGRKLEIKGGTEER